MEPAAFGGDGEVAVAESADEVKRLPRRLLVRKSNRVVGDVFLDGRADVRRCAEEAVGGHEPFERLVGTLEVVGVDEELHPTVTVGEVGKDRPREKLVPERLPETLYLAESLRVLRATLDVADAVQVQLALEVGLATPRRVLTPLVGEDFARLTPGRDSALECFDDEVRALMVRNVVRDDEARMVVHEGRHVETLVAAEQKREDVGLPKLVGLGTLEATRWVLARP